MNRDHVYYSKVASIYCSVTCTVFRNDALEPLQDRHFKQLPIALIALYAARYGEIAGEQKRNIGTYGNGNEKSSRLLQLHVKPMCQLYSNDTYIGWQLVAIRLS